MTVRVHRPTGYRYWRWTCDDPDCLRTDSASTWDEAMEGATGHAAYRHAPDIQQRQYERLNIFERILEDLRRGRGRLVTS